MVEAQAFSFMSINAHKFACYMVGMRMKPYGVSRFAILCEESFNLFPEFFSRFPWV
jgi:hypothetical protein